MMKCAEARTVARSRRCLSLLCAVAVAWQIASCTSNPKADAPDGAERATEPRPTNAEPMAEARPADEARPTTEARPAVTVRLASLEPVDGYAPMADELRGTVYVAPDTVITSADIDSAKAFKAHSGPAVLLTLTAEGARKMEAFTKANLGGVLAILVDEELTSTVTINSTVTDKVQISGKWTKDEAKRLAERLNR